MTGENEEKAVERQLETYGAMYQVSLLQRDCIARNDLEGLNQTFGSMRQLMDQIRLDQGKEGQVRQGVEGRGTSKALREVIERIQRLHSANETAVRRLMAQTRLQLKQFQQGRRQVQNYGAPTLAESRFVDSKR